MDDIMVTMYLFLLSIIVGSLGAVLSLRRYQNYWKKSGLIAHAEPKPFFGNIFSLMFKTISMPAYISQIYNLFPEAKYTGILQSDKPIIVIRDPELIKDIAVKNFDNFTDHDSIITEDADPLIGRMLFFLKGNRWREMRNKLTPSFTGSKMKYMFQLISNCSERFVQFFLNNPEEANSVELKDTFMRYTNDVIATVAFGISINSIRDRDNEFYLRGKDAANVNSFIRFFKMFALRYFKPFMKFIGEQSISRSTTRFFKTIVQETVKLRKEKNIVRPDMIQLLIEASHNENGVEVTIDDIVSQALIFLLGGLGTSATVMAFVAHELAINPDIQEKLRKEVDEFTTNQDSVEISYDSLSKMKYLDMVISETLRKYPPNAMIDRVCVNNKYTLPKSTPDSMEYTIEPDSVIWLPVYALHHDEKYFSNPEKFDPERFNDENMEKINPFAYFPFGLGPRKCIGVRFAMMEIKILFVRLLQNFILEREERTKHPLEFEKSFVVVLPDGDMWVKLKKRIL